MASEATIQPDKRVLHTKESIKTALMQLMLEKDLAKITISQITEKASVNRTTFYLHYEKISEIVDEIEEEFAQEISQSMEEFNLSDVFGSIYSIFSKLSSALASSDLRRAYIVYSSDSLNVTERLKTVIVEKALSAIINAYPTADVSALTYPLTFIAGGIIDCYIKWVKDESGEIPLDALIRELSTYTEYVLTNLK